jgi:hypothetical protein
VPGDGFAAGVGVASVQAITGRLGVGRSGAEDGGELVCVDAAIVDPGLRPLDPDDWPTTYFDAPAAVIISPTAIVRATPTLRWLVPESLTRYSDPSAPRVWSRPAPSSLIALLPSVRTYQDESRPTYGAVGAAVG